MGHHRSTTTLRGKGGKSKGAGSMTRKSMAMSLGIGGKPGPQQGVHGKKSKNKGKGKLKAMSGGGTLSSTQIARHTVAKLTNFAAASDSNGGNKKCKLVDFTRNSQATVYSTAPTTTTKQKNKPVLASDAADAIRQARQQAFPREQLVLAPARLGAPESYVEVQRRAKQSVFATELQESLDHSHNERLTKARTEEDAQRAHKRRFANTKFRTKTNFGRVNRFDLLNDDSEDDDNSDSEGNGNGNGNDGDSVIKPATFVKHGTLVTESEMQQTYNSNDVAPVHFAPPSFVAPTFVSSSTINADGIDDNDL